jgi:G protein-coupled receptor Mth (Methuselah protein)
MKKYQTLLIVLIIWQIEASPVKISKCCRIGDLLTSDNECEVGVGSPKWAPRVYFPKRKTYFNESGTLPNYFDVVEAVKPKPAKNCQKIDTFNSADIYILGNGSLYLFHKHSFIHNYEEFCVDQFYSLICRQDSNSENMEQQIPDNMTRSELNKCCGPNQIYLTDKSTCAAIPNTSMIVDNKQLIGNAHSGSFELIYKFPDCPTNEIGIAGPFSDEFYNSTTGELRTDVNKTFAKNEYCLDHVWRDDHDDGVSIFACVEHFMIPSQTTSHNQYEDARLKIYPYGLLISVLFLIATLAIGYILKSNHHLLHFRTQTNYVICLLIGDFLLAITQLAGNSISGFACILIAHLMHFFFLATFFWLNTMCFNIWWTFR